jgi:hypothetical protein
MDMDISSRAFSWLCKYWSYGPELQARISEVNRKSERARMAQVMAKLGLSDLMGMMEKRGASPRMVEIGPGATLIEL